MVYDGCIGGSGPKEISVFGYQAQETQEIVKKELERLAYLVWGKYGNQVSSSLFVHSFGTGLVVSKAWGCLS